MSNSCDDFIRSTGRLAFVNLFLKYALFVVGLVCIGLTVSLVLLSRHVGEVKPLPIFIDRTTGTATPVDFQVLDARGEERLPVELEAFVRDYLNQLYTYNRLTVKSNLDAAFARTAPDARAQVRRCADLPVRADIIGRAGQGICRVTGVSILGARPDLRVQAVFEKTVLSAADETLAQQRCLAMLRLKVIHRTVANAHGLVVAEYNESEFEEGTE